MLRNSKVEMGDRFKNTGWVKVLGWISVLGLTGLNLKGLPDSIAGFFGDHPTATQTNMANIIAIVLIVAILALLAWTIWDLYKGNQRYEAHLAAVADEKEAKADVDEQ